VFTGSSGHHIEITERASGDIAIDTTVASLDLSIYMKVLKQGISR